MKATSAIRLSGTGPAHLALRLRDRGDLAFVLLAAIHGVVVLAWPVAAVIALGAWWNLNTIAHNFIHRPFFRSRALNRCFALYLTALLGVPQTLWRERHLAHHAGRHWRLRYSAALVAEAAAVLATWMTMAVLLPDVWWDGYLPGYLVALALCALHGHYEHADGTVSHYGRLYNWLFFNDGYHCEHHARPGRCWHTLPRDRISSARTSRWPAVLRWFDDLTICGLLNLCEQLLLRSALCQRLVIGCHADALRRLAFHLPPVRRIAIVGGGLFPRTAIALRRIMPEAELTVIDSSQRNLLAARRRVGDCVHWIHDWYDPQRHVGFDVVVIPLAYVGDREALYVQPPAPAVLIHDWMWRRRRRGVVISYWLLKRLNLVQRCEPPRCSA